MTSRIIFVQLLEIHGEIGPWGFGQILLRGGTLGCQKIRVSPFSCFIAFLCYNFSDLTPSPCVHLFSKFKQPFSSEIEFAQGVGRTKFYLMFQQQQQQSNSVQFNVVVVRVRRSTVRPQSSPRDFKSHFRRNESVRTAQEKNPALRTQQQVHLQSFNVFHN